jgi:calcineurin-like phosphoesterase family protein
VRTLVISDLHLGSRNAVDVLRRPAARDALLDALDGVDRLVVLGDLLELRHGPLHDALAIARPILQAIGERLGPDRQVVLVPGNHDFRLIGPWLEWRARDGAVALGLEEHAGPDASTGTRAIADALAPTALDVAYPGIWLDDGVYATHGHYLDRHVTIPGFERLASGVLGRLLNAPADRAGSPDDYELVLAPMYAFLDAVAERVADGRAAAPGNASARAWSRLSGHRPRQWHGRLLAGAFPLGIGALNRVGIGPLKADLSGPELRRAGLRAIGEVVARLGIDARHVIFGHTHRSGPLPDDVLHEWRLAGGASLLNTGCWVYESMYLDRHWGSPYWPGGAAVIDGGAGGGRVRLLRLLAGVDAGELRPPTQPAPA